MNENYIVINGVRYDAIEDLSTDEITCRGCHFENKEYDECRDVCTMFEKDCNKSFIMVKHEGNS